MANNNSPKTDDFRQIVTFRLKDLVDELHADSGTFHAYSATSGEFYFPVSFNLLDPASFEDPRMSPRVDRVAGNLVRERREILADQMDNDPILDGAFARRERVRSVAAFPLVYEDNALGVLFINFRQQHVFTGAERTRLAKAAREFAELLQSAHRNGLLPPPSGATLQVDDEAKTFHAVLDLACNVLNLPVSLWLLQQDGVSLRIVASTGVIPAYCDSAFATLGDGSLVSRVVETEKPIALENIKNNQEFLYPHHAEQADWNSLVAYPIKVHGQVRGVFEVYSGGLHRLEEEKTATLKRLTVLSAVIIENNDRSTEAEEFAAVASALSKTPGVSQALQIVVRSAQKLTGADSSAICFRDSRQSAFILSARSHASPGDNENCLLPDESLLQRIIESDVPAFTSPKQLPAETKPSAGVPIRLDARRIGVLSVSGHRANQFTQHHIKLLQTLADQASSAMGWFSLLLKPSEEIEKATAGLFDTERFLREFCQNVHKVWKLHYCAIQLVHPSERVIETVYATGIARPWVGRSKHYLEVDALLRDIQADIALANPPRVEMIVGDDQRFDRWVFETFKHFKLSRVFIPLLLVRDLTGKVIDDERLRTWLQNGSWHRHDKSSDGKSQRRILEFHPPRDNPDGLQWEIIGTLETGYKTPDRRISDDQAISLTTLAACLSLDLRRMLLKHVLEAIVERAAGVVRADYASLHFDHRPLLNGYLHKVFFGSLPPGFMEEHPPRQNGLGQHAILARQPLFVPDPSLGHRDDHLAHFNPPVHSQGVRAMAAIPLFADAAVGVLYVGFRDVHRFTEDEIGWLQLLANAAVNAIRHATAFTYMRDRARLLTHLHSVAQFLVSRPEDPKLSRHIAWNALNILGADIVTIYECVEDSIEIPPVFAGRLRNEDRIHGKKGLPRAPQMIMKNGRSIYDLSPFTNSLLHDSDRPLDRGQSFVEREGIRSVAAIPLKAGEETVGVLFVNYRRHHQFTDEEKSLIIPTLASVAAIAIRNRRLLNHLDHTDGQILTGRNHDVILQGIVSKAARHVGATIGEILYHDAPRNKMVTRARYMSSSGGEKGWTTDSSRKSVVDWVMHNRSPWVGDAAQRATARASAASSHITLVCVPVHGREAPVLGVLTLARPRAGSFDEGVLEILAWYAQLAAFVLKHADESKRLAAWEDLATPGQVAASVLHQMVPNLLTIKDLAVELQKGLNLNDLMDDDVFRQARLIEQIAQNLHLDGKLLTAARKGGAELLRPGDVLKRAMKFVRGAHKCAGSILRISPDLPDVSAHEELLMWAFVNVMRNAIDAMPAGGKFSVIVKTLEEQDRRWVSVAIRDTGAGMDEAARARVGERGATGKKDGHGHGLWFTKTYVEGILGGALLCKSEVGKGSTFTVKLPAATAKVPL